MCFGRKKSPKNPQAQGHQQQQARPYNPSHQAQGNHQTQICPQAQSPSHGSGRPRPQNNHSAPRPTNAPAHGKHNNKMTAANQFIDFPNVPAEERDPYARINTMIQIVNEEESVLQILSSEIAKVESIRKKVSGSELPSLNKKLKELSSKRNGLLIGSKGLYHEIFTAIYLTTQGKITEGKFISRSLTAAEILKGLNGQSQMIRDRSPGANNRELDMVYIVNGHFYIVEAKNTKSSDFHQLPNNMRLAHRVHGSVVYAFPQRLGQESALRAASQNFLGQHRDINPAPQVTAIQVPRRDASAGPLHPLPTLKAAADMTYRRNVLGDTDIWDTPSISWEYLLGDGAAQSFPDPRDQEFDNRDVGQGEPWQGTMRLYAEQVARNRGKR